MLGSTFEVSRPTWWPEVYTRTEWPMVLSVVAAGAFALGEMTSAKYADIDYAQSLGARPRKVRRVQT